MMSCPFVVSWLTSYVVSSVLTHIVGVWIPLVAGICSPEQKTSVLLKAWIEREIDDRKGTLAFFISFCLSLACSLFLLLLLSSSYPLFLFFSQFVSLPSLALHYFPPPLFPSSISSCFFSPLPFRFVLLSLLIMSSL